MVVPVQGCPYILGRRLGKGTYGQVFEGLREGCTKPFALKQIPYHVTGDFLNLFFREISILKSLNHNGIIEVVDVVIPRNKDHIIIVTPLMDSDLRNYVKQRFPDRKVPIHVTQKIFSQLVDAVAYCHAMHVWHRDLKPHNILIMWETLQIKIADFGLAKNVTSRLIDSKPPLTHEIVTLWYRAPEVILGCSNYDGSIDVWSMGTILFELLAGCSLISSKTEVGTLMEIFELVGTPSEELIPGCSQWPNLSVDFPRWFPEGAAERLAMKCPSVPFEIVCLIESMIRIDSKSRIACHDLKKNVWISGGFTSIH